MNSRKIYLLIILTLLIFTLPCLAQESQLPRVKVLPSDNLSPQERKLRDAINKYNEAIKLNPRNYNAYYLRGFTKFLSKDFEGALEDYNKAIEIAPNTKGIEQVYYHRGNLYYFLIQKEKAFADYEKAISINPNYQPPYGGRGNYFTDRGDLDKALADYNKALEMDSKDVAAYMGRADVYFKKEEFDKSLRDLEKAVELGGESASAYLQIGMILGLKGYWYSAEGNLRKAIKINANSNSIFTGNISVTLFDFDEFIAKNPKNAKAYAVRGIIKFIQNKDAEAVEEFKKAFEIVPGLRKELSGLIRQIEKEQND